MYKNHGLQIMNISNTTEYCENIFNEFVKKHGNNYHNLPKMEIGIYNDKWILNTKQIEKDCRRFYIDIFSGYSFKLLDGLTLCKIVDPQDDIINIEKDDNLYKQLKDDREYKIYNVVKKLMACGYNVDIKELLHKYCHKKLNELQPLELSLGVWKTSKGKKCRTLKDVLHDIVLPAWNSEQEWKIDLLDVLKIDKNNRYYLQFPRFTDNNIDLIQDSFISGIIVSPTDPNYSVWKSIITKSKKDLKHGSQICVNSLLGTQYDK